MDGLELTNPMFWVSIVLGGVIVAAVSYGFQLAQEDPEAKELNVKGLIRDVLLGGIFTAMAWTLVPDTMKSITNSVSSFSVPSTTTVAPVQTGSGSSTTSATPSSSSTQTLPGDVDIQVGPARF